MRANYQGSTHKTVDTSALVWRIADKAKELRLQEITTNREGRAAFKPVPDLRTLGREKFATSSLATFNKKVRDMAMGRAGQAEDDDLPVPLFQEDEIDPNDDIHGEIEVQDY